MSRRAATGIIRVFPAPLAAAAAIILAAALLAACGGSSGGATPSSTATAGPSRSSSPAASPTSTPSAPATRAQSLYFLRDGKLGVAERRVALSTMPATAAVKALLAGPSAAESAAGLSSGLPPGTRLKSLIISGGVATVDLNQGPDAAPGGAVAGMPGTAELVDTLTHFSSISGVRVQVKGRPWPAAAAASPSPVIYRRAAFRGFEPAIFVESPGAGAVLPDPFTLSGTASVFEGSFTAQLTDDSGRRVVRVTVQASLGAPGRGRFRQTIVYSTSATRGTLTVYTRSMEDGTRQNVVKIPVTLAP